MGASLRHTISVHPPRTVEPISKVLDTLIRTIFAPRIDTDDSSNFRQVANKKKSKGQRANRDDSGAGGGEDKGGGASNNADRGPGDSGTGDGAGDGGAGDGGDGEGGGGDDGDHRGAGEGRSKKKGKKGKNNKQDDEEKTGKEEKNDDDEEKEENHGEEKGEMGTSWDDDFSSTPKNKKGKGKVAAVGSKSKKNDDEKNGDWLVNDDDTKQEDEKDEKVETEPFNNPLGTSAGKKTKKGKKVKAVDQWTDQGLNEAVDNEGVMGGRKQETENDDKQKENQEPISSSHEWSTSKTKKDKAKKIGPETIHEDEATKKNETESTTNENNWPTGEDENQMLNESNSLSAEASEYAGLRNSKKKRLKKAKLNSVEEEVPEKKDDQQAPELEEADIMDNEEENKDATTELGMPPTRKKKKNKKDKIALAEDEDPPKRDDNQEEVDEKIEKAEDVLNAGHWDSPISRKKLNKKAMLEEEVRKNIDREEKVAKEDTEAIGDTFDQRPKADTKKKSSKKGKSNMNEEETQHKDAEEEVKEDTWTTGNGFEPWPKNDTKKIINKKGKPIENVEETQKKDTEEKEAKNAIWDGWSKNDRDDGKRKTNKKGKLDVDEDEQKKNKDDKDGFKNAFSWDHDGDDWEGSKSADKKDNKSKVRGSHSRIHHILWLTSLQAGALNDLATSPGPMYGVDLESMDLGLGESQHLDLQFGNEFGNWGTKWDTNTGKGDMNTLGTDTTKGSNKTTSAWSMSAYNEKPEETSTSFGVAKSWGTDNFLTNGTQEKPAKGQSLCNFTSDNKSKEGEHGTNLEESSEKLSWGAKLLTKKKNKKGDVEPLPLPTVSIPEYPSNSADKKKTPKKHAEPPIQEDFPTFDLAVDSWGDQNTPKESKKAKNGTKSEAEKANDPRSNIDNFRVGGLGDNEYGDFGVAKKDKESPKGFDKSHDLTDPIATEAKPSKASKKDKKKKKEATLGSDDQVTRSSELEPENESETKFEKDQFSWGFQDDKKTSKGASTESEKFDFLNFESEGVGVPSFGKPDKKKGNKTDLDTPSQGDNLDFFDTTKPVAEFDDFSSSWIAGTKKIHKGTSDVKGSEAAIPAIRESTEVTFTATTELQAKKERTKKVKKSKPAVDNTSPETVMEKIADLEESTWDGWGSRSQGKDKNEPDEQEKEDKKTKSGRKGKLKTKELLAGSTPDEVSIEPDIFTPWGDAKKSLMNAPPPAPSPPRQVLSPEPTTSSISGLNGTADAHWATTPTIYQPPNSKSKKDVKKADNSQWAAKGWNDLTEEFNEESLKDSPEEETLADASGNLWGFGSKTTKSKASREKEKAEAAKKEEEEANLIDLQDSTNASLGGWKLDPIDDSAVTKSSKSKETNVSKATSKNSKESDKAGKISDNYKSWNTDRIDESVVTKGSKSKESNVSKATSKKSKENSENYGYQAWDNSAIEESVVTKGSKSKDSNVGRVAGKTFKENDKDEKKKTSAKADAGEVIAEPVEPVKPVSPVFLDESNDYYNQASEEASKGEGDNNDDVEVDAWSFWGSTKKKTGTKKKEDGPKKEIAKSAIAEPIEALNDWSNTPEPSFLDDKPESENFSEIKTSKKAMPKLTGKSAVLQRVKAFEATRAEKEQEEIEKPSNPLPSSVVEPFEPLDKVELPPKKVGKSKAASGNKGAASKKKDLSPPPVEEKQASKDLIPGSFPSEAPDDDFFIDILDPPVKENKSKESSKLSKLSKASKELPKYKEEPAEEPEADILIDVVETPSKKKSNKDSSKLSKANKKSPKSKKETKMEDLIDFDTPTPPELPDLQDEPEEQDEADEQEESEALEVPEAPEAPKAPESPPTPPPEPVSAKPAKKERAKVVRDEGASWAFWGASPRKPAKKELKAKDDAVTSPAAKERSPQIGLTRSKSTKAAKEKEKETEKTSAKSSGSDKDKKPEPRMPRPRPSGFGGFFGGLPPPRAKLVRKPSAATPKNFSRRESIEVDVIGIPSPPAEEAPEMNNKAARLMGTTASKLETKDSIRAKPKGRRQYLPQTSTKLEQGADYANIVVPDPYPIDDDDMILVNDLEDPVINPAISKPKDIRRERSTNTRAKKEVRLDSNSPTGSPKISAEAYIAKKNGQVNQITEPTDDSIMLETGPSFDGAELPSLQEALAFDENPRSSPVVQRALPNTRKSDSKLMGLFGGFRKPRRASEMYERPRKAPIDEFDATLRRKRGVTSDGDPPKRIRHEDRKVRRAEKTDGEDDGFITEAPIAAEPPAPEIHEFGRDEQRPKRPSRIQPSKERKRSRLRDVEDQRLKRQEADQAEDKLRRAKTRERRERKELEEAEIRRAERRAKRAARDERSKDAPDSREGDEVDIRREEKRLKSTAREGRPMKEEPQFRDFDPIPTPERQSKRREKDLQDRDKRRESSSRPRKSDRRRPNIDSPRSPGTRPTLERRRSSRRTPGEKDKSSSHRRSSAQPPVDSYFDSRNGAGGEPIPNDTIPPPLLGPLQQDLPYMHSGGNDHTSSWVKSQISEPPPPPPVEPSVLDPPPILGPSGLGGDDSAGEEARRALRRKSRKQSRAYGEPDPEVETSRRRRRESSRKGIKSEGSAEQERDRWRRKNEYGAVMSPASGRSPMLGTGLGGGVKRGSWFQKFKDMADGR